jgi:hypothetical protein
MKFHGFSLPRDGFGHCLALPPPGWLIAISQHMNLPIKGDNIWRGTHKSWKGLSAFPLNTFAKPHQILSIFNKFRSWHELHRPCQLGLEHWKRRAIC